jgi:hypothetical protein
MRANRSSLFRSFAPLSCATVRRISASVILFAVAIGIFLLPRRQTAATLSDVTDQKLWAVYWTTETGYTSILEMKNNRVKETLTARPTLYFRSGEELPLAPVTLGPRQTAVLNINQALAVLPADPRRERQQGTLKLDFEASNEQGIMGTVSVTNPDRGIAWNFRLYAVDSTLPSNPLRGVFWFPDEKTRGLVELQNASEEFITVSLRFEIEGRSYVLPPARFAPDQGYTLDLREELHKLGLDGVKSGGIELAYEGAADSLKAHEVLFNNQGFSTEVDLIASQSHGMSHPLALRTPQFAVGPADPRTGLPPETSFKPTLVLHNFDSASMAVTLFVGFQVGNAPTEKQFPVTLTPGETQVLALQPLLKDLIPPNARWASLEIQTQAGKGLATALVSVSQDGGHSIRSVLNWVEGSASDGPFWQADAAHDTLIGMFNADTEPAKVSVSLDYYVGTERHQHKLAPLMVPARSAEQVDVGAIVAGAEADAKGDIIPGEITFGGYRVQKVGPRIDQVLITQSFVFDRNAKSFLTFYNTCCGFLSVSFSPGSLTGVPGGTGQLKISAFEACSAGQVDVTDSGTFTTQNANVATVGEHDGQVSFVGPGQTDLNSSISFSKKCSFVGPCCQSSAGSNTTTTVQVPTSLSIVSGTDSTTAEANCTTSGGLAGCGVTRTFKYQVNDQNGHPISVANMQVADVICNTSTNQLNLQGYKTTCGGTTGSCSGTVGPCDKFTDGNGQFPETLSVCAPACKPSGVCTTAGQTIADQTWYINGTKLSSDVKSISYQCNKILVNGK